MWSILETVILHVIGIYGQWLGYSKGWLHLIGFWVLMVVLVWLGEKPHWSRVVQVGVQTVWFGVLVLFLLGILKWAWVG